jgi:hypothetical protein
MRGGGGMRYGRKKTGRLWLIVSIVFMILAGLWELVIKEHRDFMKVPAQHFIGNRSSSVEALKETGLPVSFLVIGDNHATETGEALIRRAMKEGTPSFMVMLGDFVSRPDLWIHRLFLTKMTTDLQVPFPVFLVSGNHDIDYKSSKIKQNDRRMTLDRYESFYGPRNFSFTFHQCLFVICGIDPLEPRGPLRYLQETLSRQGEGKQHTFIFIHTPPRGLAGHIDPNVTSGEELLSFLEKRERTTCFFGDTHAYWREQRRGATFIVSGGGGGRLERYPWGRIHHLMRITVDKEKITEEILTIPSSMGFRTKFERLVFGFLFPILQKAWWVLTLIFVFLLLMTGFSFFRFLKSFRVVGYLPRTSIPGRP